MSMSDADSGGDIFEAGPFVYDKMRRGYCSWSEGPVTGSQSAIV